MGLDNDKEEILKPSKKVDSSGRIVCIEKIYALGGSVILGEVSCSKKELENTDNKVVQEVRDHDQREHFIASWNSILFLHRGESKEKQIRLRDIYTSPDFTYSGLRIPKHKELEKEIDEFINRQEEYRILIICGQPGMGKSSLVAKLASENNDYVYLLFRGMNIAKGILIGICNKLECQPEDLENKTIIIDGYDEATNEGSVNHIEYFIKSVWMIEGLKIIITSRQNYINVNYKNVITLKPFEMKEIVKFNEAYSKKAYNLRCIEKSDINKVGVCGIPLVLYMIYALNIDIKQNRSLNELYSAIFAIEGGIYDKCRREGVGYGNGAYHPITSQHKETLHMIAQKIAFAMFEKGVAELSEAEYLRIVKTEDADRTKDFAIANFYDIGESLCFIHRTIYEYFVAEYIIQEIKSACEQSNKEELAKTLCKLLNANFLNKLITDFIYYKLGKDNILGCCNGLFIKTFENMLSLGIMHYLNEVDTEPSAMKEMKIFYNLMDIIHFWESNYPKDGILSSYEARRKVLQYFCCLKLIPAKSNFRKMILPNAEMSSVFFNGADLSESWLNGACFVEANLKDVVLINAKLMGAKMNSAYLKKANLTGANLCGADLYGADLTEANFCNADLREVDLRDATLKGTDFRGAKLQKADFRHTNFTGTRLDDAILSPENIGHIELQDYNILHNAKVEMLDGDIIPYAEFRRKYRG